MLFELFFWLKDDFTPFNVFRYVSFRVVAAMLTSLLISFLLYPWFIRKLQSQQIGQVIREDGPDSHFEKAGTPTMGGVLILFAVVISTLLWADLKNPYVGVVLGVTVCFAVIGFFDDFLKLREENSAGLSGKMRLCMEFGLVFLLMMIMFHSDAFSYSTELYLPFVATDRFSLTLPLWIYVPFAMMVIVGTANAVNLTDGLDGLAIGPVIVAAGTFLILAWSTATVLHHEEIVEGVKVVHRFDVAEYLMIPKVEGVQELSIFCAAIVGAGVGFLWYNSFPAQVFMGDVGSGYLGYLLGMLVLVLAVEGRLGLLSSAVLLVPFWVDASYTLVVRLCTGQRLSEAHRSHAYQHLARQFGHGWVATALWGLGLIWLLPLAALSEARQDLSWLALILAVVPVLGLCLYYRAGTALTARLS